MALWKVLGLPQCQTLLVNKARELWQLSIDFKMSRIGVARVEKRQVRPCAVRCSSDAAVGARWCFTLHGA